MACVAQVARGQAGQRRAQCLRQGGLFGPLVGVVEQAGEGFAVRPVDALRGELLPVGIGEGLAQRLGVLADPVAQARNRRQGGKGLQAGQVALEIVNHALEQEVAEGHPAQPRLGIADRVEDRRAGLALIGHRSHFVEQLLDVVGERLDQRDLDEDQRFERHPRVEEGVAAAVVVEAVLEVFPRADLMHRFVLHQPFEQRRGRLPGDALELQKADVEPRVEARFELAVEGLELGVVAQEAQQVGAQVDQKLDPLRDGVELGQDADPARAHRHAQARFGVPLRGGADLRLILGVGLGDARRVGAEFERDHAQESMATVVVEFEIGLRQPRRALARGDLAAGDFGALPELLANAVEVVGFELRALLAAPGNDVAHGGQAARDDVRHTQRSRCVGAWPVCVRPRAGGRPGASATRRRAPSARTATARSTGRRAGR